MIEVTQGNSPIVLALPHTGTDVPPELWERMTDQGRALTDTDWHIHQLYSDLGLDLTRVRTPVHRYVIDVNRPVEGTGVAAQERPSAVCPLTDFDGNPLYVDNAPPDAAEIARRVDKYHAPYHAALAAELTRVRDKYGVAILYDCHSIRSVIPTRFEGTLPDFNICTHASTSCSLSVERSVHMRCRTAMRYTCALNQHFEPGWTVQNYGQPAENIHAIQMVLAQSTYMDAAPAWGYRPDKAELLRPVIYRILSDLVELVHERHVR